MPDHYQIALQSAQTLASQGKKDHAADAYLRAAAVLPDSIEAHLQVASALQSLGRLDEAVCLFFKAAQHHPDRAEIRNALGIALLQKGRADEALAEFQKVTEVKPQDPRGFNNLACMLALAGRTQEAIAALRHVLVLDPRHASGYRNLGNALKDFGDIDAAIACYDKALLLDPHHTATASNRLYAMHFSSAYDAMTLYAEHQHWCEQHFAGREPIVAHDNDPSLNRRLRVGYVSPDFRQHVVGWNLVPLLRHHDHQHFEIFCYASVANPDALTTEIAGLVDHWRNILGVTDPEVARMVRADRIDILVDLSLHLDNHRLAVFARKPAPLQVTYLGYCGTTGLDTMDYRFSDSELDPPGAEVNPYCEETVRLPKTYWCYAPGGPTPPPSPLPALIHGTITFGCLNNFAKVSNQALALWARVLRSVPKSRLILHVPGAVGVHEVPERIVQAGIPLDRLEMMPRLPWDQYIGQFSGIDISLDPFPYAGGITTCDSLWMGVPVVTLRGHTAVGRSGASILTTVGLPQLIARDEEEYVRHAVDLAGDLPRLGHLRAGLRAWMETAPLMDARGFARDVETAYRGMWERWCAGAK